MKSIRKSLRGLWHLFCACIPGCGQMSQGYMKRGISQMIIFSSLSFIAIFLEIGALAVLLLPLWAYSFFDSFNLRRHIREGMVPDDEFMFGMSEMDSRKLSQILNRRGSLIGWLLVVVGLYNLYQIFARNLLGGLREWFPWLDWLYHLLVWDAPRILGTVLIIALGLWFIKGPKSPKDDGPSYTPPKSPPKPPKMKATPWPEAEDPEPVVLTWKSAFDVEKYEKEAAEKQEADHDGQ